MVAKVSVRFYPDNREMDRLFNSPTGDVAKDLTRRAIRVESAAKRFCPVDTGRLRSSIAWELGHDGMGLFASVGTNVHYAKYVEFGTRRMSARPFLRPSIMAAGRGV